MGGHLTIPQNDILYLWYLTFYIDIFNFDISITLADFIKFVNFHLVNENMSKFLSGHK